MFVVGDKFRILEGCWGGCEFVVEKFPKDVITNLCRVRVISDPICKYHLDKKKSIFYFPHSFFQDEDIERIPETLSIEECM